MAIEAIASLLNIELLPLSSFTFHFRGFDLLHSDDVWKVGTDSVLLGAWIEAQNAKRALDIGTGTGVLSLMLAQRFPDLQITAVDILPQAVDLAAENFATSGWSERLHVVRRDISEFYPPWQDINDLIVCNPPYFPSGLHSPDSSRRSARQGSGFSLWELPKIASGYLNARGRLSVVIPGSMAFEFIEVANENNLFVSRRLNVRHIKSKPVTLVLLELARVRTHPVQGELVLYKSDSPTREFVELSRDYLTNTLMGA
jgi:tRNA1Val (adenine37-N6)-methyltransferase